LIAILKARFAFPNFYEQHLAYFKVNCWFASNRDGIESNNLLKYDDLAQLAQLNHRICDVFDSTLSA